MALGQPPIFENNREPAGYGEFRKGLFACVADSWDDEELMTILCNVLVCYYIDTKNAAPTHPLHAKMHSLATPRQLTAWSTELTRRFKVQNAPGLPLSCLSNGASFSISSQTLQDHLHDQKKGLSLMNEQLSVIEGRLSRLEEQTTENNRLLKQILMKLSKGERDESRRAGDEFSEDEEEGISGPDLLPLRANWSSLANKTVADAFVFVVSDLRLWHTEDVDKKLKERYVKATGVTTGPTRDENVKGLKMIFKALKDIALTYVASAANVGSLYIPSHPPIGEDGGCVVGDEAWIAWIRNLKFLAQACEDILVTRCKGE